MTSGTFHQRTRLARSASFLLSAATCAGVCTCGDLSEARLTNLPQEKSELHERAEMLPLPEVVLPPSGQAYDLNCEAMAATEAPVLPVELGEAAYFDAPVPRRLHQIWYGPTHPLLGPRMQSWSRYAEVYGYDYKRWGASDDDILALIMPVRNYQIMHYYIKLGEYKAVSDVLRLSLLSTFGGIYLDSDLQPPSDQHGVFDLDEWVPMTNMLAIAEGGVRETHSSSVFFTNCFLMASVGHPLIAHLVHTLPTNHAHWQTHYRPIAEYTSGPFFLTRSVAGAITTLPNDEAYDFHLFGGGEVSPFAWGLPPQATDQKSINP